MDKILGFIVNHQYIWIIAVCIFALMLVGFIADLKDILANPERIISIIISELDFIKDNFSDERRTKVNP